MNISLFESPYLSWGERERERENLELHPNGAEMFDFLVTACIVQRIIKTTGPFMLWRKCCSSVGRQWLFVHLQKDS